MPKNHTFRFRVTKQQFEQIKNDAAARGYVTIAPYIRDLALKRGMMIESKIIETNNLAKQILEALDGRGKQ